MTTILDLRRQSTFAGEIERQTTTFQTWEDVNIEMLLSAYDVLLIDFSHDLVVIQYTKSLIRAFALWHLSTGFPPPYLFAEAPLHRVYSIAGIEHHPLPKSDSCCVLL